MIVRSIAIAAMVVGLAACNMAGVGKAGETPEAEGSADAGGGDAATPAPSADGKPADASAGPSDGGGAKPGDAAPAPQPQAAPSGKP